MLSLVETEHHREGNLNPVRNFIYVKGACITCQWIYVVRDVIVGHKDHDIRVYERSVGFLV